MITLLHLSDIHFRSRDGGAQFDLDAQLRKPLLDDIRSKPAEGLSYDGLLITGDIAFGGKKAEYDRGRAWLEEIFAQTGLLPENTYMVPGNHDVNRDFVVPGGAIWNNHVAIRKEADRVIRHGLLETQLARDPACNPLAPLEAYNDFAQGYGCRTEKDKLAWVEYFPKLLDDGSRLRLHGLNSALTSDEGDQRANLYVAPFQTQHFAREPNVAEMVLCHHPPHWLLDMIEVAGMFRSYARVALFGHEHSHRTQMLDKTVQLFAGAVHPAARDPDWLPTYHIIRLSTEGTGKARVLVVRIYSRELRPLSHVFVTRAAEDDAKFEEHRVDLPEWYQPAPTEMPIVSASAANARVATTEAPVVSSLLENMPVAQPSPSPTALRELLVHFHRLSTPVRYTIATKLGLLRDGDDVPPQRQWDLVFQRAQTENRLGDLWKEIAARDLEFSRRGNPFE